MISTTSDFLPLLIYPPPCQQNVWTVSQHLFPLPFKKASSCLLNEAKTQPTHNVAYFLMLCRFLLKSIMVWSHTVPYVSDSEILELAVVRTAYCGTRARASPPLLRVLSAVLLWLETRLRGVYNAQFGGSGMICDLFSF